MAQTFPKMPTEKPSRHVNGYSKEEICTFCSPEF